VAEENLDLLKFSSVRAIQLGAGPAQIMRGKML
jgi:hypothetical protein